jgi:hypothetical protein
MTHHSLRGGATTSAQARALPAGVSLPPPSPSARWVKTLVLAGCGACLWLAPAGGVSAQDRKPAPTLEVASQIWLSPGTESRLEAKVIPAEAIPPQSVIVIRGVPAGMRFSEGRLFGAGVWVLPASRLPELKLHMSTEIGGGALTIVLTTLEGVSLAETQITVLPTPPEKSDDIGKTAALQAEHNTTATSAAGTREQAAPSVPPKLTSEHRAELHQLLEKGKESLRLGNVLIARQFFERAASKGLAEAALALAATYDPRELPRTKDTAGVTADAELARKWYEKARELGSPDAAARLSELGRR